jgi:hypothetical protein
MGDLVAVLAPLGFFGMIGWIVHVIVDGRRRRERLKVFTEFHTRLLDRIGSTREFGEFLQTDGGTRFLETLSLEGSAPKLRILRSIQAGIVLLALGVGLLMLGRMYQWDEEGFTVMGTIALSLAVGFLASSAVSYRLSKSMGLLTVSEEPRPRQAA